MNSLKTVIVLSLLLLIAGPVSAPAQGRTSGAEPEAALPYAAKAQVERLLLRAGAAEPSGGGKMQALLGCLDNENRAIRRKAAYLLGEWGDPRAVDKLVSALDSKDRHLRRIAACALGKLHDKRAARPLIGILRDRGESPYLRRAAAHSLSLIGSPEALAALYRIAGCNEALVIETVQTDLSRRFLP